MRKSCSKRACWDFRIPRNLTKTIIGLKRIAFSLLATISWNLDFVCLIFTGSTRRILAFFFPNVVLLVWVQDQSIVGLKSIVFSLLARE
jgi:hypothetical protein